MIGGHVAILADPPADPEVPVPGHRARGSARGPRHLGTRAVRGRPAGLHLLFPLGPVHWPGHEEAFSERHRSPWGAAWKSDSEGVRHGCCSTCTRNHEVRRVYRRVYRRRPRGPRRRASVLAASEPAPWKALRASRRHQARSRRTCCWPRFSWRESASSRWSSAFSPSSLRGA